MNSYSRAPLTNAALLRDLAAHLSQDCSTTGRLHLTAVVLLPPQLTADTAEELLAAAARESKAAIERLLAERFPQSDLPTVVQAIAPAVVADGLAPVPAER